MPTAEQIAAPVHVLTTARRILTATFRGLARCWLPLLGLAAVAFSVHHVLIKAAAEVAASNGPAGIALLVLAITFRLVVLAVMLLVAARHITLDGTPLIRLDLARMITERGGHHEREPRLTDHLEALLAAIVPLALLYAGWQFVDADLHQFLTPLVYDNLGDPAQNRSNINFDEGWKSYVPWAAGAWLLKVGLEKLHERLSTRWLVLGIVYLEVTWIVLTWLVFLALLGRVGSWWGSREVVRWWRDGIGRLGDLLHVPLPDVVRQAGAFVYDLVSLVSWHLVMPTVWVAVAALVLGWGLSEASLVHGSRLQPKVEQRWEAASNRRRTVLDLATRELREKYLPVLATLRLLWRTGLLTILTIGVLYAVGSVLGSWVEAGVVSLVDPDAEIGWYAQETVGRLVQFLLGAVSVCFLVATFAEVVRQRADRLSA